jgi:hypothetical protein
MNPRPHPAITMTDVVTKIERGEEDWYGVLVSAPLYAALEMRTAAYPDEVPLSNRYPVAVDKSLSGADYRLVDHETWDEVTQ